MAVLLQVGQVAVRVQEKGKQSGWVSAREKWKKQFADRGYGTDSRGQTAGLKATVERRSRV